MLSSTVEPRSKPIIALVVVSADNPSVALVSGVTRVGVTRGGNWRCHPYFSWKKNWRPFLAIAFCKVMTFSILRLVTTFFHSGVTPCVTRGAVRSPRPPSDVTPLALAFFLWVCFHQKQEQHSESVDLRQWRIRITSKIWWTSLCTSKRYVSLIKIRSEIWAKWESLKNHRYGSRFGWL